MKKYDPLWSDINNLLSHLEAFNTVGFVEEYYAKFDNLAPKWLLEKSIQKLQKHLDQAEENGTTSNGKVAG